MVCQSSHSLRCHFRGYRVFAMWPIPLHALDTLRSLQPTLAVLDPRPLHASALPVANAPGFLPPHPPGRATKWRHRRLVPSAHRIQRMAHQQDGVRCHLWLVHLRRGLASELISLQALSRSLQALLGSCLRGCGQVAHHTHRLLSCVPAWA